MIRTSDPSAVLGHVVGGRVLDAATGDGQFIGFLLAGLKDHQEVIGIDREPVEEALFNDRFKDQRGITFQLMDALDPRFPDASFDTVSIANSLCEFEQPSALLARLQRLLRLGGHLIVASGYRDRQTPAAHVYVQLHDWWAAADRELGKIHHAELRRRELVALIAGLGLTDARFFDVHDPDQDRLDAAVIARIDGVIDRTQRKVQGRPDLVRRGEVLRERMQRAGFEMPTSLVAVGRV